MQYLKSKGGYYYQITKKGEKKRISEKMYKSKIIKGGNASQLNLLFEFLTQNFPNLTITDNQNHILISDQNKNISIYVIGGKFVIYNDKNKINEIPMINSTTNTNTLNNSINKSLKNNGIKNKMIDIIAQIFGISNHYLGNIGKLYNNNL
jgi:predicted transcriptional regulator